MNDKPEMNNTNPEILRLFEKAPHMLPLYLQLEKRICDTFENVTTKIGKTQVSFFNRRGFAWIWPPFTRRKGWPKEFLGVTFGLGKRTEHPRIVESVEPYPGRWTHHVLIVSEKEIDEQLMDWLRESYFFALTKR